MGLAPLMAQTEAEHISPIVQQASWGTEYISLPKTLKLQIDPSRRSSYTLKQLRTWLQLDESAKGNKGFALRIGIVGDKSVSSVSKLVPQQAEGYYLRVDKQGITISGRDERGLYYGLQSLRQMASDGKLALGSISDYPDVPYRGVVEGFYGTPWSYEDRLSQLDFYGQNKLNVYIYGPKDDPYHSVPNWRKPYPTQEAQQIKSLVERAKENGVIFYWAIHPGQDIRWDEADRKTLIDKFEHMYALGVRGFAVFFDDISGEGTKADKQAELLNYIDNHFIKVKKDVAPLIMCPTEYNKGWSNIERGYLPTLGDKLNQGIEVMWTGNTVVATLDKPDLEWINKHIKRKAYVWFNFPVSDFVRNHLLLGATYGNSLEIAGDVSGFLSNPMEHAESSKIALYSVADYTWNMKRYDYQQSWERAMHAVFPEAPEALHTFAKHSSALGKNGHLFDREESVELRTVLEAIQKGQGSSAQLSRLLEECRAIQRASNTLLASESNPNMIDEMKPWLRMAKLVGEYGEVVLGLDAQQKQAFLGGYQQAKALQRLMYLLDIEENQNPYQPGVKYGSQHLMPALNAELLRRVESYNKSHGTALKVEQSYTPFSLTSTIPQLANQAINTRGKQVNVSPSLEVIRWSGSATLTLQAKRPELIKSLELDLGTANTSQHIALQIQVEGKHWERVELKQEAGKSLCRVEDSALTKPITGIRLVHIGEGDTELRLRRLAFNLR